MNKQKYLNGVNKNIFHTLSEMLHRHLLFFRLICYTMTKGYWGKVAFSSMFNQLCINEVIEKCINSNIDQRNRCKPFFHHIIFLSLPAIFGAIDIKPIVYYFINNYLINKFAFNQFFFSYLVLTRKIYDHLWYTWRTYNVNGV
jgi:hypothetical protein